MISGNLPELFFKTAAKNNDKIAFEYRLRRNELYRSISWGHLYRLVHEMAYGLIELGIKKNDKVAIISETRYEWAVCDLAVLSTGAVLVPIYPSLPETAVEYILNNSEAEIVILEDKGQLQKIRSQWEKLPKIRYAVVIEDLGDLPQYDSRIITINNLKDKGKLNFSKDPYLVENQIKNIDANDLSTIIYTSGTTGDPKGVELTHKNILSVVSVLPEMLPLKKEDKFLSFLPLSHVFERVGGFYFAISQGSTIIFCSSIDQIGASLKDSGATVMLVVPRILEKIHTKLIKHLEALPDGRRQLFNWAFETGKKLLRLNNYKKIYNFYFFIDSIKYFLADKIIFSKIRKNLAPTLRCFVSGGAPLSKDIAEFFCIIGLTPLEGYGLTETSAPATANSLGDFKLGTVGKPLPKIQIQIADDGEILIKGPTIFSNYYKNKKSTEEAFFDGWFKTGDIGIIDNDGFLKITDRKKDIIINSAGKNIAPQNIENAVKTSPYVSNIIVIGDKRKYLTALLTLEVSSIIDYANKHSLPVEGGVKSLVKNPAIIKLIDEEIKLKTAGFADYEQIRKFTILPNEFTVKSGEITPTLKIKRRFVQEKYKQIIDLMCPMD